MTEIENNQPARLDGELLREKVAEAIRADGSDLCDAPWETLSADRKIGWLGDADRALAAVKDYLTPDAARAAPSPQAVEPVALPDGWVAVPRDPTMDQRTKGYKAMQDARYQDPCGKTEYDRVPRAVYYAMLSASPQLPAQGIEADRFPVTLGKIHEAIDAYVEELVRRQHGGIAMDRSFNLICQALGRDTMRELTSRSAALRQHEDGK